MAVIKPEIKFDLIVCVIAHIIICSAFSLLGFWSAFKINIFQYMEASDLFVASANNLTALGIAVFTSFWFMIVKQYFFPTPDLDKKKVLSAILSMSVPLGILDGLIYWYNNLYILLAVACHIAMLLYIIGVNDKTIINVLPNKVIRHTLLLYFSFTLCVATPFSRLKALNVINSENYSLVFIDNDLTQYKYLGTVGSTTFLLSKDNKKITALNPQPGKMVFTDINSNAKLLLEHSNKTQVVPSNSEK